MSGVFQYLFHPPPPPTRCPPGVGGQKIINAKEQMNEDNLVREIKKIYKNNDALLNHIGAATVPNAKRKIDRERAEFERTKGQLQEVVNALEVDNWRNAVVRAKSLLSKLEKEGLPVWLRSISPYWIGKVAPSQYRMWHRNCKEQFLVALGELQYDAELGLEVDVEAEVEVLKSIYLKNRPEVFIEEVAKYLTSTPEDDEYVGEVDELD